jgi:hypothetical protein
MTRGDFDVPYAETKFARAEIAAVDADGTFGLGAQIELLRGGSTILQMSGGTIGYGSSSQGIINVPFFWLDFPATASSVTYKTQAKAGNASGTIDTQHNGGTSTILVEEIMA